MEALLSAEEAVMDLQPPVFESTVELFCQTLLKSVI
jgi:hypothetical protein